MKATAALGKIGNFPVRGAVVNIESGDIASLVSAGTAAAKFLVTVGAITAGIAIITAVSKTRELEEDSRIPLGSLTQIRTPEKSFTGVCLDNALDFKHEGQSFSVELSRLKRVDTRGRPLRYNVTLIDGSEYRGIIPIRKRLSFASLAGIQNVSLPYEIGLGRLAWALLLSPLIWPLVFMNFEKRAPSPITICGVTPKDIDDLRRRLRYAIANTRESVIAAIGEDVFSHFFK